MTFKITWRTHLACFVISLIISLGFADIIYTSSLNLLTNYGLFNIYDNFFIDSSLLIVVIMVPIIMLHEALHGMCYILFGGRVKYGFKFIYAYCQEVSEMKLQRTKFLVILLAPVTIISLLSLLLPVNFGALVFILNLVGSTGDLLMSFYLIRFGYNSYIIDRAYGFDVIQLGSSNAQLTNSKN